MYQNDEYKYDAILALEDFEFSAIKSIPRTVMEYHQNTHILKWPHKDTVPKIIILILKTFFPSNPTLMYCSPRNSAFKFVFE